MHICKPPQGFAFGIRKEFGPPRRPLGPLARNILGGIAVARLGAPKDSRAIYLPPAISLRRRHATSSSRGFFIARQLPSPPPHNIFIATQVFVRRTRTAIWHCARNFLAGWRVGKNFGKGLDENAKRLEIPLWELCKLICNFANPLKCKAENGKPLEML